MPGSASDFERVLVRGGISRALFGAGAETPRLGRFTVVRVLGRGAMGLVCEADDAERGAAVAIKLLDSLEASALYRLKREFRALADLVHPNLVGLHELWCEEGQWFFSMELIDGVPFDDWLRSPDARDDAALKRALHQLACGVSALHAAGKLHRDLKPSNVLVTRSGRVVVLDCGLVGELEEAAQSTRSGLVGTPAYLAPEQAAGQRASVASDCYAIGVMLFQVLTGSLPIHGNPLQVLADKQRRAAPDPRVLCADSPVDLSELCGKLLLRDPQARATLADVIACCGGAVSAAEPAPGVRRPFVGRDAELEVLADALRSVRAGEPAAVLIGGESGVGKTTLLDRFVEHTGDALVLSGRCHPRESVPYKVFDAVVDALSRHLTRMSRHDLDAISPRHLHALLHLFPVLAQALKVDPAQVEPALELDARERRNRAFAALKELLLRLGDRATIVLAIDDLQWGDADSAHLLAHVFGPPEPPRVLLVGTYRSDEVEGSEFLQKLIVERIVGPDWSLRLVGLEPLSQAHSRELASALLGDAQCGNSADLATKIAAEACGVPFFVNELVQYVSASGAGALHGASEAALLDRVVIDRAAELPDDARRLLQVLCLASRPIEHAVALAAAGLSALDRESFHVLRRLRLARGRGGACDLIETYHDRIRETLSRTVEPEQAARQHGAIADAMECHEVAEPERIIVHHLGAGDRARAASTALSAASAAARKLAFVRAVELYDAAIGLMPADDDRLYSVHVARADALASAGRGALAAEAYLAAARLATRPDAHRLKRLAAQQSLRSGRTSAGLDLAEQLLGDLDISIAGHPSRLVARLLWNRLQCAWLADGSRATTPPARAIERVETLGSMFQELMLIDPLRGALLHSEFMRCALRFGEPIHRLQAHAWDVFHLAGAGGSRNEKAAAAALARVGALRRSIATRYAEAVEHMATAGFHLLSGRFASGLEPARRAVELFGQGGGATYWERSYSLLLYFSCSEFVGDIGEVIRSAPELVRDANEREDQFAVDFASMAYALGCLAQDQDQPARVLEFMHEQRGRVQQSTFTTSQYYFVHRTVDALIYAGDPLAAWAESEKHWSAICAWLPGRKGSRGFIRATIESSRLKAATSAYAVTRDPALLPAIHTGIAALHKVPCGYGNFVPLFRGYLLYLAGKRDDAVRLIEESVRIAGRDGVSRIALFTKRRLGEVMGGAQGRAMIEEVDAELSRQGIVRPARMVTAALADIGTS